VTGTLRSRYDLFIFDLDGVVVLGRDPIPHAVEAVNALVDSGARVAYATNNASRDGSAVSDLLSSIGIHAAAEEAVTSAQASARILAQRLAPGDAVLVVGGDALRSEIRAVGLKPVDKADDEPRAVVQGYAADVGWAQLAEACVAVRAGATWVATNADRTLPSPRGELPGNGSLVAALATALGRQPDLVVGKPAATLFRTAAERVGAKRPLVIGDRLDTDIAGAVNAGMDSLVVLTGVAHAGEVLAAPAAQRPTYIAADLRGLSDGAVRVPVEDPAAGTDGWSVTVTGGGLELSGSGTDTAALAVLAAAAWAATGDEGGAPPALSASGAEARTALDHLGLRPGG
jgi:HAD superfamily hydrolase (TIGR01450 family)